jgi:hypothetical protein
VKNLSYLIPVILSICISCGPIKGTYNPSHKIAPEQLQSDFALLQKILEKNHPSLYWYAPKDTVDHYFKTTYASLKDSLTELEYKNKVAWVLSKLRCGHTVVRNSTKYSKYYANKRLPLFPLAVKVWEDSAVVVNNLFPRDSLLKRGTIITSINNMDVGKVIDSMCQLIGSDGYANNLKYQLISFNFPAYYKNTFGVDSQYQISYLDSTWQHKKTTVKNFNPISDSLKRIPLPVGNVSRKQYRDFKAWSDRNMIIDTALSTAVLSINTFSEGRLKGFFKQSFRKMRERNIKNLVIDLRQNSGGDILASTKLCQYLVDKPFNVADTVAAYTRSFPYKKHIRPWFVYWLSMHFTGRRYDDGRIHFKYFEQHKFRPKKNDHFDGNIYLVTGGYTFSAAALVTNTLKGQQNVTVVGEETGGGAYGNTAMHLPTIILPNTGIRVTLPLYRLVLSGSRIKNGRGIFPDVEVKPSSYYIRKGIDGKLEKVRELIINKKSTGVAGASAHE